MKNRTPMLPSPAPQDRGVRTVIWSSLAGIGLFIAWATHAELDQITRAPGQLIPSSRTQIVQVPDGGVLLELLVREGAEVQRGQLIARLDAARVEASVNETKSRVAALRAAVARLQAEIFSKPPQFDELARQYPQFIQHQTALLNKRRAAISEEIASIDRLRRLAEQELSMTEPLLRTGDVSRAEVLRLQRQVADLQGQAINRSNRYFQETQAELGKAQEELAAQEQMLLQKQEQLLNTRIHAPLNGVVSSVKVTTIGGVLRPGEELLQVVPLEDELLIEARVKPADVAFLKPGLPASVKVDAYDYTVYGSLQGTVSYISADTLDEGLRQGEQAYYRVQVKTGRDFSGKPGQSLPIQPGMTAMVEIKTGTGTVFSYLAKPVVKTLSESLGER